MKLTEWLTKLEAIGFYPHGSLHDLHRWGIRYLEESGQLMGDGLIVDSPRYTQRGLMEVAVRDGWVATFDPNRAPEEFYYLGYGITAALVELLLPFEVSTPSPNLLDRFETNIRTLRGRGF